MILKLLRALSILFAIVGVISAIQWGYEKAVVWKPDFTTPHFVFVDDKDPKKPIFLLSLENNGYVVVNVPEIYKRWQEQAKAAKRAAPENKK